MVVFDERRRQSDHGRLDLLAPRTYSAHIENIRALHFISKNSQIAPDFLLMKVFVSYSHADERAVERLKTHTAMLEREGLLTSFVDRQILAGGHIDKEISRELETCDAFIAMVSPDFLASNYCYQKEMTRAIELHEEGRTRIIPVIVEECDWKTSPLAQFKALPKDAKPIATWENENAAYLSVVSALREIAAKSKSGAPAKPVRTTDVASSVKSKPAYRTKKTFDAIDRIQFREKAFRIIRDFFKSSTDEIGEVEGVRSVFRDMNDYAFTCTVINQAFGRGIAHITVRMGTGRSSMGDISWMYEENAEANSANGWWSVGHTEYDQHLEGGDFSFMSSAREKRFSPKMAAEKMWEAFIEKAGISHA